MASHLLVVQVVATLPNPASQACNSPLHESLLANAVGSSHPCCMHMLQEYIATKLQPILIRALTVLAREKPSSDKLEAIAFLANWMLENNPNKPQTQVPPEMQQLLKQKQADREAAAAAAQAAAAAAARQTQSSGTGGAQGSKGLSQVRHVKHKSEKRNTGQRCRSSDSLQKHITSHFSCDYACCPCAVTFRRLGIAVPHTPVFKCCCVFCTAIKQASTCVIPYSTCWLTRRLLVLSCYRTE